MAHEPESGNGGTLSLDAETLYNIRSWSRSVSADNQAYVSSQTAGRNFRIAGNRDMTFSASLYSPAGYIDLPVGFIEGDTVAIIATTNGVRTWTGNIIIDTIDITVNIETGENIGIEITGSAVDATSYAVAT